MRACSVNQSGSGSAVVACPDLGPANDQFVLQDGKLPWFTRSGTLWSHYQTLRASAPTETVDCP